MNKGCKEDCSGWNAWVVSCNTNYTWNGSSCVANTQSATCGGTAPANTTKGASTYTQTRNGSAWTPTSNRTYTSNTTPGTCQYTCASNYTWNGNTCSASTQSASCGGTAPANTTKGASTYTQTRNGSAWTPTSSRTYTSNTTPAACQFKCNTNYTWNGSSCVINTQSATCGGTAPANTTKGASTYTQTRNGTAWTPTSSRTYTSNSTPGACQFKCNTNYTWNGSACTASTGSATCGGTAPANTTKGASTYTQTRNGTAWTPTNNWAYTSSTTPGICQYTCNTNYTWNGSSCIANTRTQSCATKPANTVWNTVSSVTQTWNGSAWTPANTTSYNTTASTTACRYTCAANYTWNGSSCVASTRTESCATKPANTIWNTVSSITQTWNGSAWTPANTTSYNTTASTTACRYTCATNYTWNGSSCVADTKIVTFNGNGGSGHSPTTKTIQSGQPVGTLPTSPTRAGYTFNGWYTAASGGSQVTASTVVNANVTYYAQWTVLNRTVTFNGNGGSGHSPTTKTVQDGQAVGTLPTAPTRAGYTFNGWYTATSGGSQITTSRVITSNVTYYAQWTVESCPAPVLLSYSEGMVTFSVSTGNTLAFRASSNGSTRGSYGYYGGTSSPRNISSMALSGSWWLQAKLYCSGGLEAESNILTISSSGSSGGGGGGSTRYKVDRYGKPFEWEADGVYYDFHGDGSSLLKLGTKQGIKSSCSSTTYNGGSDPDVGECFVSNVSLSNYAGVKLYILCSSDQRCRLTVRDSGGIITTSGLSQGNSWAYR
ncbi:MAG: InlB B-repeat-containing protein [Candidatus Absconditabacteria bacterium]|nr:InlB B-repeat-containing protein [Candidatus Absconditabacteria bacterium]